MVFWPCLQPSTEFFALILCLMIIPVFYNSWIFFLTIYFNRHLLSVLTKFLIYFFYVSFITLFIVILHHSSPPIKRSAFFISCFCRWKFWRFLILLVNLMGWECHSEYLLLCGNCLCETVMVSSKKWRERVH